MRLNMLLDMAAEGFGDRVAVTMAGESLTFRELHTGSRRAAAWLATRGVDNAVLVDANSLAVPTLLYGAAAVGLPFAPLNYRLADAQLADLLARTAPSVAIVDAAVPDRVGEIPGVELVPRDQFLAEVAATEPLTEGVDHDPEGVAILLFTSGTTGDPKAAILRHRHLTSYIVTTVEFMGAEPTEAALVSVPPYHVAGISAVLSGTFSGRRSVYLESFSPESWVEAVTGEQVSHAMVVPTMLGRILDLVDGADAPLPSLRHLSYGGGRMPLEVVERALAMLPDVDFVNAYGLTETSSTISVLGPEDHRVAAASDDPALRRRLGSVGKPLPGLDVTVRGPGGEVLPLGEEGEVWVRGDQVAGEYAGRASTRPDGWFPTRDGGWFDDDGYLHLVGRLDDVIVRGAENISPGEVEDLLRRHPAVSDACVVGVPDEEWGESVAAQVVLQPGAEVGEQDLKDFVRSNLRSSRTPTVLEFSDELPYNETGKLLRRVVRERLVGSRP